MVKITPRKIFTYPIKKSLSSPDFFIPSLGGKIFLYFFNAIWKTLACFTIPPRGGEITSKYLSVWLWTVTHFNTPENQISVKLLLVIGNGFLISTWKYWISKNESILRTTAWKLYWLLFYPKLSVGVSLCFS